VALRRADTSIPAPPPCRAHSTVTSAVVHASVETTTAAETTTNLPTTTTTVKTTTAQLSTTEGMDVIDSTQTSFALTSQLMLR